MIINFLLKRDVYGIRLKTNGSIIIVKHYEFNSYTGIIN